MNNSVTCLETVHSMTLERKESREIMDLGGRFRVHAEVVLWLKQKWLWRFPRGSSLQLVLKDRFHQVSSCFVMDNLVESVYTGQLFFLQYFPLASLNTF